MFAKQYAQFYELFNSKKPYNAEVKFVYRWAGKPASILDIGCGTAEYWKYYPSWTQLVGLEKSKDMRAQSRYSSYIICADVTKKPDAWRRRGNAEFDCVTALFDVINYIPKHDWWKDLPLKKGGYLIFDIWDKKKIAREGFKVTLKNTKDVARRITPRWYDENIIDLTIDVFGNSSFFQEKHRMYLHSHEDIVRFCGNEFEIVEVKPTKKWQTWYKLRRK